MTDQFTTPEPGEHKSIRSFIADTARPIAIILVSFGACVATIMIAHKVTTFGEGALFIAAVFTGLGALYGAKAWENSQSGKHAANVEIAKAAGPVQP